MILRYKGSRKHKPWEPHGYKGSICPEWTHALESANEDEGTRNVEQHDWPSTQAQELLNTSIPEGKKRYATGQGEAFCALPTNDGTWHGYPIPWKDVPESVKKAMIDNGDITRQDIKRQMKKERRARR